MMKFISRFILTGIIFIVVLVGICLLCTYLALSKAPFSVKVNSISSFSSMLELKSALEKEYKFISSSDSSADRTITFNKAQINSAFDIYLSANQIALMMNKSKEQYNNSLLELRGGSYEDSKFVISLSQKLPFDTPLGNYLNVRLVAQPYIEDNKLKIKIYESKVGNLPIPSLLVAYILKEKNSQINNTKEVRQLVSVMKKITLTDDSVTIVYNPEKLLEIISSYSDKFKF